MSDTPADTPCGAWPSPLSPEQAAAASNALDYAWAHRGRLYWIEDRPTERGRSALMTRHADGRVAEALAPDVGVRSRVHEYGGRPYAVVGDRLAYVATQDQRLRVHGGVGDTTVLTPEGCRYADGQGAPDGRTLVCVREDHRGDGAPRNAIVALDLDGGAHAGRVLYDRSDFVASPRVSPDGRRLAFIAWDHPAMPWDETRLIVGDWRDGSIAGERVVAGGPGESVLEPRWDGDGTLYFLSDRAGGWWNLHRWRDGRVESVTALEAEIGGPAWRLGGQHYALTGDGRALVCVSRGAVESLALIDVATGGLRPLALPFVGFDAIGVLDAATGYAIASAADAPPALITIDLRDGRHDVVRTAGPRVLAPAFLARAEAIEFPTAPAADGTPRTAHAWFYPPRHPGHRPPRGEAPPLIVLLHGGPTSVSRPVLKLGVQFWTTRGFAVVDVNYGGSAGFGRAYRERLRSQWGVVDVQDAVAAVDHLAAAGRIDGRRVAIRGASAGGFTVLSALAFTDRFTAGINYFGVADLETLAADTHKFESRYLDSLVAPLPQGRAVYRERSPAHHMHRCRAALLTLQGSDDRAVPPQQSRAVVQAARAAGCPVAYLEFEGEQHGFREAAHIVRALQAECVFLGWAFGFVPAGSLPPLAIDNATPA